MERTSGPSARVRLVWALAAASTRLSAALVQSRPNPPVWPPSVQVFGPEDDSEHIKSAVQKAFRENGGQKPINHGEFSSSRYAFLFKPGKYSVDVPVGYYTQVLGLGGQPGDVIFDAERGIYCEESNKRDIFGSLSTFWRGAENFRTRGDMLWATSQATPIRRAIIDGDLYLSEYKKGIGMGYSSGGFIGNVQVGGTLQAASQQQYCTRNAQLGEGSAGGVWNMVYIGTEGAPEEHCSFSSKEAATVTVDSTPMVAEKPFVSVDDKGKYHLHIPLVKRDRKGIDFSWGSVVGFEKVYVARTTDSAAAINQWLRVGFHVVLTPGIYHLEAPLFLSNNNQVLLGIGFATLIAPEGLPAVRVGNVDGVRVSGVLLEAGVGSTSAEALLEFGDGKHRGEAFNPSFIHDVFARVGGTNDPAKAQARAKVMVKISSNFVVGDNLWLWRADHGVSGLVKHQMNPCDTGLLVTGNNVTMYGLAVEHTLKDLVQWSGEGGKTFFFQSELPYDVTQAFGDAGYVGYRVGDSVRDHEAYGVGVYHFFRDHAVTVKRGISVPTWLENSIKSPLSIYLNGKGKVEHTMNGRGSATSKDTTQAEWICDKVADSPYAPPTTTTATSTATTATTTTSRTTLTTTTSTLTTATHTGTATRTTTSTTSATATTTLTGTTTTTTTTVPLLWGIFGIFDGNFTLGNGWVPWLLGGLVLQTLLVVLLSFYMCCGRRTRTEESKLPLTSILRMLSRQSSVAGDRSRVHFMGTSPERHRSPSRSILNGGRTFSLTGGHSLLGTLSPGPSETTRLSLSPRIAASGGTPGRRTNAARTLSMGSVAESGFSESPGGAAMLSPWGGGNSPMWRAHGEARSSR
uniref:Pectate lyase superfamily protein domain-containing protein n=1 Tax=Alexandrium monilatum TaxID=311494 RepID=A0A7S4SCA5_9DINO